MNWMQKMRKHAPLIVWIIVITFAVGIAWWSISYFIGGSRVSASTVHKPSESQAIALVTKNGTPLSYQYWVMPTELQNYMQNIIANYKNYYGAPPDSLFKEPELQVNAIKQLVDQKVIDYFANTNNISISSNDIDSQLKAIVNKYASNPQAKDYIIKRYGSIKNFENAIKPDVKQSLTVQKVTSLVANVTESDVKNYYESHKTEIEDKYDEVKAAHILVSTQATANKILNLIKSKKITFSKAAEKYSKDTASATNGGELEWFTRSQMVPQFSNAAFNAKVGQIVGPIQTQYGWHLIDVEGKRMYDTFDAIKSSTPIYNDLLTQVKNEKFANWLKKYKADEKISYRIQGEVLPYVQRFYSIPATNVKKVKAFIEEMDSYVYPSKSATVNTSIDPRLLALYESALEEYKSDLQSQNAALESYHYSSGTFPATYVGLSATVLQKKLDEVSKEMDTATGTTFSKLFDKKLELQKALNYANAIENLRKLGYKNTESIKKAYDDYQKKLNELSSRIKQVLSALYQVAPYSSDVVTKLYKLEPSNKKVALQYFQNEYKLIEPVLSNKQTYQMYSSRITPVLEYVKSGLENITYTAESTSLKTGAIVTLIDMSEKMGNLGEELKYLKKLKEVDPHYQGVDQVIKQVENAISASSTSTKSATSLQSTPTLKIPTSSNSGK